MPNALRITSNAQGQLERVTVAHKFDNVSQLVQLQQILGKEVDGFTPYQPSRLHFTTFQFGIPIRLYKEIQTYNSRLSIDDFMHHFYHLLSQSQAILSLVGPIPEIATLTLSKFGSERNPAIVVTCTTNKGINDYIQLLLDNTLEFLVKCGTSNPEVAIGQIPTFRQNPISQFKPHITLGRAKVDSIPARNFSTFNVQLLPPYLEHVEVM